MENNKQSVAYEKDRQWNEETAYDLSTTVESR